MLKSILPLCLVLCLAANTAAQELFVTHKAQAPGTSPMALVEAEVTIDRELLRQPTDKLILVLPDGNRFEALLAEFEQRADGGTTWWGQVPWRDLELPASVVLTLHDELVAGTISTPDGIYEIRPQRDRSHRVSKVDRSAELTCGGAVPSQTASNLAVLASPGLVREEVEPHGIAHSWDALGGLDAIPEKTSTIEVLAIYSSGARAFLGGHSQIQTLIQHAVDYASSAFRNSATSVRVSLRHVQEMPLDQSVWDDLFFLSLHEPIQTLRDEVGADVVAAFAHQLDVCGRAYLMDTVGPQSASRAFSYTHVQCGTYVFSHELGHNLGMQHDPANAGANPLYPWAYGHFVDQRFRTVMSYSTECTNYQCPTIPQFSHPGLTHQGLPTGIPDQRHNARVLSVTGPVAAAFRAPRARLEASFTAAPTRPAAFESVTFTDRSSGTPETWSWSFGDGATSNVQHPTHAYTRPGSYTVGLTVSRGSRSETITRVVTVEAMAARFEIEPASPRVGLPTRFLDRSTGSPSAWSWSFGDGASSDDANPTHTYAAAGTYPVELTVERGGRSDTFSTEVEVRERSCGGEGSGMCLNQDRFAVEVEWTDFDGQAGIGTVAPQGSDDSGIFWFFDSTNLEMLVKVLDGCALNDHFWVFAAATTNVGYTLRVTDTFSGQVQEFTNPVGTSAPSITATEAFATCAVSSPGAGGPGADGPGTSTALRAPREPTGSSAHPEVPTASDSDCQADATQLCLNRSRFQVEVVWRDFEGQTGDGSTVFNLEDSGMFWFFSPTNWEMLVKVLDGCAVNGNYWVFGTATTNVEYTLKVTDTESGEVREYHNPLGVASAAITDTAAFAACP
ncbi:MAG: PKD domain-containing protein [Acidobacteriota bacterium]